MPVYAGSGGGPRDAIASPPGCRPDAPLMSPIRERHAGACRSPSANSIREQKMGGLLVSALLQAVLACPRLAGGWSDYYGISSAKCNALTATSTRKSGYSPDSFDNPKSETALSLFLLGNVDGWKQLNGGVERLRVSGGPWNPKFFELLTAPTPILPFAGQPRWSDGALSARLFESDEVDYERLVLLFEVEAGGKS